MVPVSPYQPTPARNRLQRTICLASAVRPSSPQPPPSTNSSSQQAQQAQQAPLEAACNINKAVIGVNPQGYRGLLAASSIAPGEVVLSIPLHNMLQVPRQLTQPDTVSAAAAALATWQQQHWQLPVELTSFLSSPDVIWESKLVAWLLYLKAAASAGSLWHSYIQSLPAAADAITFCSYNEAQAEQLQFSVWKVRTLVCVCLSTRCPAAVTCIQAPTAGPPPSLKSRLAVPRRHHNCVAAASATGL